MPLKLKKISKYILIIFMILQPFFDIYYLYTDEIIKFFKFSPATIIRMIFIIYLVFNSYLILKNKIKKKYLISFGIIYFFYTILHLYNSSLFLVGFQSYQNYSNLKELFYLIRLLCPLLLIFITMAHKIKYQDMRKIILSVYFIFSGIMILTNLFGVALTSYSDGNKIIASNFFSWFSDGYSRYGYEMLASKGIFHMANQVSGVMTVLFPILMYIVLTDKFKITNMIVLFMSMLSMFMLGTRIASLGMLAVLVLSLFLYAFFKHSKKEKVMTKNVSVCLVFLLMSVAIYQYLPVNNRTYMQDNEQNVLEMIKETKADQKFAYLKEEIKKVDEDNLTNDELLEVMAVMDAKKIKFIEENYKIYGFDEIYILTLYPYTQDPDFWLSLFNVPFKERCDHRQLKTFITKRIIELNDNNLDTFFGLTFTRLRNALIYMENDLIVHFYTIGIFGIILFILPYLFIGIYALFKIIKNKKNFTYLNITYLMTIFLTYLIGYLSGNIFDEWIVTLFLGFVSGALIVNLKKKS